MHIDEANINNLVGLWKKYGSQPIDRDGSPRLYVNTRWPHRVWSDNGSDSVAGILVDPATWVDQLPVHSILPLWPDIRRAQLDKNSFIDAEQILEGKRWACSFTQTAMFKRLLDGPTLCSQLGRPGLYVVRVTTLDEVLKWVDIASEAFGYSVDPSVIESLVDEGDIQVLLAERDGQAVATALLYKTGDVIGIHQVGVKRAFQGQGIARLLMLHAMDICVLWQGKYLVLQASQAGKPLYESLGFTAQFAIKNFQRTSLHCV